MKMLFAVLILAPIAAAADHRPEFQSLIGEPANMLDIAMIRLEDFIFWTKPNMAGEYHSAAKTDKRRHIDINAHYSEDEGVIHVSASLFDLQSTPEQMEAGCRRVLTMLRINLRKGLDHLFSHVDHSFRPSANGEPADLLGMIELSCHVYGRSTSERRFGGAMLLHRGEELEILKTD